MVVSVLDLRAIDTAVRRATVRLELVARPWARPGPDAFAVYVSPEVARLLNVRELGGVSVTVDPTISTDIVRVRDLRSYRDEIVRLSV